MIDGYPLVLLPDVLVRLILSQVFAHMIAVGSDETAVKKKSGEFPNTAWR